MNKDLIAYTKKVRSTVRAAGSYSKALELQIYTAAVALLCLDKAIEQVKDLKGVTVEVIFDNGQRREVNHPAFDIIKGMMDRIIKLMKPLGLSAELLMPDEDADPMVELTERVLKAGEKPKVIKPKNE